MSDSAELSASAPDPAARDSETTGVFPAKARRYRAFISYSHADTPWANWLLKKLEGYRVPVRFHGRPAPVGEVGPRLAPVFRDRDELPTTSDLGETIRAALRESATLIVICSPSSAKSRWVQEEIIAFKRLHGERRVFALIVAGEPKAEGTADDCFSPALRRELAPDGTLTGAPAEVVAADARPHADGKSTAFVRLLAGLLGVGFDELRQRELQRRSRRLTLIAAASVIGMVLTLGLAVVAWRARNDAQRRQDQAEDVLAFMLGDFREDLKKVGQLALLQKVGNKAMGYFDAAAARDLTDSALARHAKALTQIGEVKLLQKDVSYAEAARAFSTAYKRAAELAARHPADGEILFERAQAEYWVGFVHRRRHDLPLALEWFSRYRDSSMRLVALDSTRVDWRKELFFAHKNLATLDVDRRRLEEAQAGFLAARRTCGELLAAAPLDTGLRYSLSDTESWLGNVSERRGELRDAVEYFQAEVRHLDALRATEPKNTRWSAKLAEALKRHAGILAAVGDTAKAAESLERAQSVHAPLTAQDPANRVWERLSATLLLLQAELASARGDSVAALRLATEAGVRFESTAEPSDPRHLLGLTSALCLAASLSEIPRAAEIAQRAVHLGQQLVLAASEEDAALGRLVRACFVAGDIAERVQGDLAVARQHWQQALDAGTARASDSADWRLLDPMARVLAAMGRPAESRAIIKRMDRSGYRPLHPWPASSMPPAAADPKP